MKKRLNLIFILVIILFASCQDSNKQKPKNNSEKDGKACIERILSMDDQIGKIRNHECEKVELSLAIKNYIEKLESLDYTNCPEVFVQKFRNHIKAWSEVTEITDKYADQRGEMHDLFKIIEEGEHGEIFKLQVKKIWDTWAEVETISKK